MGEKVFTAKRRVNGSPQLALLAVALDELIQRNPEWHKIDRIRQLELFGAVLEWFIKDNPDVGVSVRVGPYSFPSYTVTASIHSIVVFPGFWDFFVFLVPDHIIPVAPLKEPRMAMVNVLLLLMRRRQIKAAHLRQRGQ